jgi:hydrogenase maturation protease
MIKLLVLGIGNPILGDDGIGPRIVEDLKPEFRDVDFLSSYICCIELLEQIQKYNHLLIVDATISTEKDPGAIAQYTIDNYQDTLHLDNYHDVSLKELILLGQKLGYIMPEKIDILVVNVCEDKVFSTDFSPEVKEKYPQILSYIGQFIQEIKTKEITIAL